MNKESIRSIENPISVLKINETELTGSMALVAYALIYTSKNPGGKISFSELESAQRDHREGLRYKSRFIKLLPRVLDALDKEGIQVLVSRFQGKSHGMGPRIEYRIVDEGDGSKKSPSIVFSIEDGSNFRDARGPKANNSFLQQAKRINEADEQIARERGRPRKEILPKVGKAINVGSIPSEISRIPSFENAQMFFSLISCSIPGERPGMPYAYEERNVQTYEEWARRWEILGRYLGTDAFLAEMNREYGYSKSRIQQLMKDLMISAYKKAPEELKNAISLNSMLSQKPITLRKALSYSSGAMQEAIEALQQGESLEEIKNRLGVLPSNIRRFQRRGLVNISNSQETKTHLQKLDIEFLENGLLDDDQIRRLFKDFEDNNNVYASKLLLDNGITTSLREFSRNRNAFIGRDVREVYEFLKENNIPIFKILNRANNSYYTYVLNGHEKTEEIFNSEYFDKYRENPVTVFGREVDTIPTTNITNSPKYMPVSNITERALNLKHGKVREAIGKDCPVSVYAVKGNGIYIKRDDLESFSAWLESQKSAVSSS